MISTISKKFHRLPVVFFIAIFILTSGSSQAQKAELYLQLGHSSSVLSVGFSPDGAYAVSGSYDNSMKLWEVSTGREIRSFSGHTQRINSVSFSPDGRHVASGSEDHSIKLWNASTGQEILSLNGHKSGIKGLSFSPDGNYLLSVCYYSMILWDVSSGEEVRKFIATDSWDKSPHSSGGTSAVAISQNGKYALSGGTDGTIKLWVVSTGKEVRSFKGHSDNINSLAFSPNGKQLLSGSNDESMRLWDISTGQELQNESNYDKDINSVAFSPDGKQAIAGCGNDMVNVWELSTGYLKYSYRFGEHRGDINSVAFSPDGQFVLSGSNDNTMKLWDAATGDNIRDFTGFKTSVNSAAFSPDGRYVLVGTDDKALKMWDISTVQLEDEGFTGHNEAINDVAFSPDGQYALSGSKDVTAKLWEVPTGKEIVNFTNHKDNVRAVAFSPNGELAVSGGEIWNTVKLWEVATGKEIYNFKHHNARIESLTFSPDGNYVLSVDYLNMYLWKVPTGEVVKIFTGHGELGNSVRFSPDGKYIVYGSYYNTVKLKEVTTGKEVRTFTGHPGTVINTAFSPDGKHIVSGDWMGNLKLWEMSTGREVRSFNGHSHYMTSVSFSSDGRYILSSNNDGSTIIWDVNSDLPMTRLISLPGVDNAAITHDNFYRISRNAADYLHFVDGLNVYSFENFDLIFNRPDIVAKRLGKASPELIDAYYKAYLKRLEKMGFTEDQISTDMHLPEVAFYESDFSIQASDKNLNFEVKATDSKYKLDRVNVYVNDVPIYGTMGIDVKDNDTQEVYLPIEIDLSNGLNKIQVSAHNQAGAESLKETIEITYSGPKATPDLYILAIGISDYQDDDFDLKYAAKDATDLAGLYEKANKTFGNVHKILITDWQATRESILAVKDRLMQTKADDQVMVFVAGHGVLDENLDYYLAMHDMDFYNPAARGLKYEELENLIDGIPARQKLMFLDACHSGEVDKEEVQEIASIEAEHGTVNSRGFKKIKTTRSLGLKNSFELMNELFADLRRGTGASVISSASGVEFAFESDEWKNGVFTYAILEGIRSMKADKDNNDEISVSELKDYVFDRVTELTNGKQHPTSRRENLEFDFVVW